MRALLLLTLSIICLAAEPFDKENFLIFRDLAAQDQTDEGEATFTILGDPKMMVKRFHPTAILRPDQNGKIVITVPKGRLLYLSFIMDPEQWFTGASNALVNHQIYAIYQVNGNMTTVVSKAAKP
jgi:hypothetical protein